MAGSLKIIELNPCRVSLLKNKQVCTTSYPSDKALYRPNPQEAPAIIATFPSSRLIRFFIDNFFNMWIHYSG